jgi:hypothetical protein
MALAAGSKYLFCRYFGQYNNYLFRYFGRYNRYLGQYNSAPSCSAPSTCCKLQQYML